MVDLEAYNVVSELMMHGLCGSVNPNVVCTKDRKCTKRFPKQFNSKTFFDDNGHVHYRKRDTGTDRVFARVSKPFGDSSTIAEDHPQVIDEIRNYVEGRFICAHEAYWRIFKFDIHRREPAVQILAVHLENMQRITFRDKDNIDTVVRLSGKKDTTLTQWFAFNEAYETSRHLTYLEFPSEFVWYSSRKSWSPRKSKKASIGRLAYVHPTSGELFFFRMLLCHQKGSQDFWTFELSGVFFIQPIEPRVKPSVYSATIKNRRSHLKRHVDQQHLKSFVHFFLASCCIATCLIHQRYGDDSGNI